MKVQIQEIQAKTILTPQKVGSLASGYHYSLNPYAGCAFSCSYCYVPKFPNGRHEARDWGKWLEVKVNAPELIAKDRLKIFGSKIFFSSATDPYQYIELKYQLSRQCLEKLLLYQPSKITMHTRSHLILRDIELLKAFGKGLQVGVSFTTDDESIRQQFEPSAPSLRRRLELIRKLRESGIEVYASIAPLLPCNPDRLINLLKPLVSRAWVDKMHWLDVNTRPDLLEKYKWFFDSDNYQRTVIQIQSELVTGSCRSSTMSPVFKNVIKSAPPIQLNLGLIV